MDFFDNWTVQVRNHHHHVRPLLGNPPPETDVQNRLTIFLLTTTAFWPVWKWYMLRTLDSSDDP